MYRVVFNELYQLLVIDVRWLKEAEFFTEKKIPFDYWETIGRYKKL